jgi:hypothetical protein
MVGETAMSAHNGRRTSPPRVVARNLAGLAHDVFALSELQAELLKIDLRHASGTIVRALLLLAVAVAIGLGCVPLLLMGIAYLLVEFAGWTYSLAFSVVAVAGLGLAGVIGLIGWQRLRGSGSALSRSRDEFRENIRWIKSNLVSRSGTRAAECAEPGDVRTTTNA